ncbi:MAG: hypothetical protein FD123_2939 [Bacteroidetes bacterium]|nr:MAG: hypothetical protein FD123_2939 [Bacteroidota bacterium]
MFFLVLGLPEIIFAQPSWILSGAPVGDTSTHMYPVVNISPNMKLVLRHVLLQDSLMVYNMSGAPPAMHVYRVDQLPNVNCGLPGMLANDRYFGVFVIGGSSPSYTVDYFYSNNPYVTPVYEPVLETWMRPTNADVACAAWSNMSSTLFMAGDSLVRTGMSGRMEIVLSYSPIVLPVDWLSVNASWLGDGCSKTLVNWQTASESNSHHFEVERCSDSGTWELAGTVNGSGNSSQPQAYVFLDNVPFSSGYYRIRQVDNSGLSTLSPVVSLTCGEENIFGVSDLFPNPCSGECSISITSDRTETLLLQVTDMRGRICKSTAWQIQQGVSRVRFDAGDLQPGSYCLHISRDDGTMCTKKLAVVRRD